MSRNKRRCRRLPYWSRFPKMAATYVIDYSSTTVIHFSVCTSYLRSYLRSPCLHSQSLKDHKLMRKCWAHHELGEIWLSVKCKISSSAAGLKVEGYIRERILYEIQHLLGLTFQWGRQASASITPVQDNMEGIVLREIKWGTQVHIFSKWWDST